jgi:WD40 repeat protein
MVLKGHDAQVNQVAFNSRGDLLASSGMDTTVRLWDPLTGEQLLSTPGAPYTLRFSLDGRWLGLSRGAANRIGLWEVNPAREYRLLSGHREASQGPWQVDISPDGRLMATGSSDGIRLWNLAGGKENAFLATGTAGNGGRWDASMALFDPHGHSLITSGKYGLHRWPITAVSNAGQAGKPDLRIGPPEPLGIPGRWGEISLSGNGQTLAAVHFDHKQAVLFDLKKQRKRIRLGPDRSLLLSIALSPDGRWVVTWGYGPLGKLWDGHSGKLIKTFTDFWSGNVRFSPDGKWLVTGTITTYSVWKVGCWGQPHYTLPRPRRTGTSCAMAAFSRDGRLLALKQSTRTLQLIEPATGKELATLPARYSQAFFDLCFSPDASQLAVAGESHLIQVWDLRRIRQQLARMGLDWDRSPGFPPDRQPGKPDLPANGGKPLTVQVDLGDLRQPILLATHPRQAVALYSLAIALAPRNPEAYLQRGRAYGILKVPHKVIADCGMFLALTSPEDKRRPEVLFRRFTHYQALRQHAPALRDLLHLACLNLDGAEPSHQEVARSCNDLAWQLVTGPPKERAPVKALLLARKAVELVPEEATHFNTLGVVQYRNAQYKEAVATLEKSLAASKGETDGFDLFFLAMCHHHLGKPARARACYDRAVKWRQGKKTLVAQYAQELKAFQAEADKLLRGGKR